MTKTVILDPNSILYITDSPEELAVEKEAGHIAVPLMNSENSSLEWPHSDYCLEGSFSDYEATDLISYFGYDYLLKIYERLTGSPWHILDTDRLCVREMTVNDVDEFYRIYQDPDVTEFMENLFENPEDEKIYTRNYIRDIYGYYGFGLWTVIYKENGRIIGRAGISMRDGYDEPELGFLIEKDYRHMGLAYEVCSAISEYANKELGFNKIQALVHPNNISSINLLKKMGFEITSKLHQDYLIAYRTFS